MKKQHISNLDNSILAFFKKNPHLLPNEVLIENLEEILFETHEKSYVLTAEQIHYIIDNENLLKEPRAYRAATILDTFFFPSVKFNANLNSEHINKIISTSIDNIHKINTIIKFLKKQETTPISSDLTEQQKEEKHNKNQHLFNSLFNLVKENNNEESLTTFLQFLSLPLTKKFINETHINYLMSQNLNFMVNLLDKESAYLTSRHAYNYSPKKIDLSYFLYFVLSEHTNPDQKQVLLQHILNQTNNNNTSLSNTLEFRFFNKNLLDEEQVIQILKNLTPNALSNFYCLPKLLEHYPHLPIKNNIVFNENQITNSDFFMKFDTYLKILSEKQINNLIHTKLINTTEFDSKDSDNILSFVENYSMYSHLLSEKNQQYLNVFFQSKIIQDLIINNSNKSINLSTSPLILSTNILFLSKLLHAQPNNSSRYLTQFNPIVVDKLQLTKYNFEENLICFQKTFSLKKLQLNKLQSEINEKIELDNKYNLNSGYYISNLIIPIHLRKQTIDIIETTIHTINQNKSYIVPEYIVDLKIMLDKFINNEKDFDFNLLQQKTASITTNVQNHFCNELLLQQVVEKIEIDSNNPLNKTTTSPIDTNQYSDFEIDIQDFSGLGLTKEEKESIQILKTNPLNVNLDNYNISIEEKETILKLHKDFGIYKTLNYPKLHPYQITILNEQVNNFLNVVLPNYSNIENKNIPNEFLNNNTPNQIFQTILNKIISNLDTVKISITTQDLLKTTEKIEQIQNTELEWYKDKQQEVLSNIQKIKNIHTTENKLDYNKNKPS